MNRTRLPRATVAALCMGTLLATSASLARADEATDEVLARIRNDVTALSVNTPIWLAQHLPATMAETGLGGGITIGDEAGGVSIGLMPVRIGVFNQFSQVGRGTTLIGFEDALPGNLPWLQFGASVGVGLSHGVELGVDVQFIPKMDVGFGNSVRLETTMISLAGALRWRVNHAHGAVPALVIGVGGSYYGGKIAMGAGYSSDYSLTTQTTAGPATIEGTYEFSGAPQASWALYQLSPEVRLAWKLGPVHPYLGFGLGFTWGDVTGGARLKARATVDRVNGQAVNEPDVLYEEAGDLYSTEPARYLLRPHIGIDFVIGPFAITTQVALAVTNQDKLGGDLGEAASTFNPGADGGFLYNDASKSSQTSAALVATLGLRLQL
ncbi:MAG: hypothetical protein H6746_06765 [Deltaproteobacteria bacterium]|nr:hypothetical protein [Deltaproteobacteria bacterium]